MSHHDIRSAARPQPDQAMVDIADYVVDYKIDSKEAYDTARYMLMDSLSCAMLAMKFPEMVKHLGPLVPGATLSGGARVPGTSWELDPVQAAALRALIREQAATGTAVILSTHLLAEVTATCDRVAILHEGRLHHDGPVHADDHGALERRFFEIAMQGATPAARAA